ncbi:hypothetical protein [Methylophaga sp. OBS4]|uniref:hypothetical protein n=1 Tax=Methylophaga sp. OBS4 TaxID=2991935 RepID=UPI002259D0CE|nr:hypothetical protein [Methylophaga sp. OBS4]
MGVASSKVNYQTQWSIFARFFCFIALEAGKYGFNLQEKVIAILISLLLSREGSLGDFGNRLLRTRFQVYKKVCFIWLLFNPRADHYFQTETERT